MGKVVFPIAQMRVRITDDPTAGTTFALFTEDEWKGKGAKALFSGHVDQGTPEQLRALAQHLEDLARERADAQ